MARRIAVPASNRRQASHLREASDFRQASDLHDAMLETYAVNQRMNQLVLDHLDPRAWRAKTPGKRGRTIAAIFTHVHNIRRKWLRLSAPHLKLPPPLDRARCTLADHELLEGGPSG